MKILKLALVAALLVSQTAFGKELPKKKYVRKPNQAESFSPVQFKIVYGDKTTFFMISKSKTGGRVAFSNNLGARDNKEISAADYEFLKERVASFDEPSNLKAYCSRNYIEMTVGNLKTLGCLGSPNGLAKRLQETTNLISLLF